MGIIVTKDNNNDSQLNQRITAELRQRVQGNSDSSSSPDFANESEYMRDLQKTNRFSWVWIALVALALVSLIFIMFF